MLSYYRNTIVHVFLPEAFIGCVLASFGNQLNQEEGVALDRLQEETIFLMNILQAEYSFPYDLNETGKFGAAINDMVRNEIVSSKDEGKVIIKS